MTNPGGFRGHRRTVDMVNAEVGPAKDRRPFASILRKNRVVGLQVAAGTPMDIGHFRLHVQSLHTDTSCLGRCLGICLKYKMNPVEHFVRTAVQGWGQSLDRSANQSAIVEPGVKTSAHLFQVFLRIAGSAGTFLRS